MGHSGKISQENPLCQILPILHLWGKISKMGQNCWGENCCKWGKQNGAKLKKMGQKSRIPGLPECHRMSQNVTESCILWQKKCHRINIMPHFEKNGASVEKMSQNGRIRGRFWESKGNTFTPLIPNRDPQSFIFQLMHPMCIPKDPVLRFPQFHKIFLQNAPKVKNLLHFLRKMGQKSENGAKWQKWGKSWECQEFIKMRNVSKTLAILAQMRQMWRIEKCPIFKMGQENGASWEEMPHFWRPKGSQILDILSQKIWGGVGELDPWWHQRVVIRSWRFGSSGGLLWFRRVLIMDCCNPLVLLTIMASLCDVPERQDP